MNHIFYILFRLVPKREHGCCYEDGLLDLVSEQMHRMGDTQSSCAMPYQNYLTSNSNTGDINR